MADVLTAEMTMLGTEQMAQRWHTTSDKVRAWCKRGFVTGVKKEGSFPFRWLIPSNAKRPIDESLLREVLRQIVEFQNLLITEVDLTEWGIPLGDARSCIYTLVESGYLKVVDGSTTVLTRKGISTLCRLAPAGGVESMPTVLAWTADAGGQFAGSFAASTLKQLI